MDKFFNQTFKFIPQFKFRNYFVITSNGLASPCDVCIITLLLKSLTVDKYPSCHGICSIIKWPLTLKKETLAMETIKYLKKRFTMYFKREVVGFSVAQEL